MAERIETDRLILEPITVDRLQDMHRIWSDPSAMSWSLNPLHTTIEATSKRFSERLNDKSQLNWIIYTKSAPSESIGSFGFLFRQESDDLFGCPTKEMGYSFRGEAWGKGYCTEAARAAIEFIRPKIAPIKLVAWISPHNKKSQSVATKLGLRYERDYPSKGEYLSIGGVMMLDECMLWGRDLLT